MGQKTSTGESKGKGARYELKKSGSDTTCMGRLWQELKDPTPSRIARQSQDEAKTAGDNDVKLEYLSWHACARM